MPDNVLDAIDWYRPKISPLETRLQSADNGGVVSPILGNVDAAKEWAEADKAASFFTPTHAYREFSSTQCLFLFGRKGTGKTALTRRLDHLVKANLQPPYRLCFVVSTHGSILDLNTCIRSSPLVLFPPSELAAALQPVWTWFYTTCAMLAVVRSDGAEGRTAVAAVLREYLSQVMDISTAEPRNALRAAVVQKFTSAIERCDKSAPASALLELRNAFRAPDFLVACQYLEEQLSASSCVVLLDSGETYEIRDVVAHANISSLINAIMQTDLDKHGSGLFVKAAFPSEIRPHLSIANEGKFEDREVTIQWRFGDLARFLERRVSSVLLGEEVSASSLPSVAVLKERLFRILPPTVKTRSGIRFDTLAYIIRHTQKTPRQLLLLSNAILSYAREQGWEPKDGPMSEDQLVTGLHWKIDRAVSDSLDMHKFIFPQAKEIVRRVLGHQVSVFPGSELPRMIREAEDVYRSASLSAQDVTRLLLQSGAIGIATKAHCLNERNVILEALYEYQRKDTLDIPKDCICVVHPMLHDWLGSRVFAGVLSYPRPSEEGDLQEYSLDALFQ